MQTYLPLRPKLWLWEVPPYPYREFPHPWHFFSIFALRKTLTATGLSPSTSAARATQRDTHIGSVHPIAGTTCCFTNRMMRSRSVFSIFMFYSFPAQRSFVRQFFLHILDVRLGGIASVKVSSPAVSPSSSDSESVSVSSSTIRRLPSSSYSGSGTKRNFSTGSRFLAK